ncbi:MAG: hypothetical protein M3256_16400 [Actinomycetota bacterium]|nr:hypothetical protein [Actinomycetota bacterium]
MTWLTALGIAACGVGIMLGAVFVAAGIAGFGHCASCRRYRQLSDGDGLVQCGRAGAANRRTSWR